MKQIPSPAIERLSTLYTVIKKLEDETVTKISSKQLSEITGVSSFTIRKDISYISQIGNERGYDISKLRITLFELFDLSKERKACIVGLGRLGKAIMNFSRFSAENIKIIAGFDSNINVIETTISSIPLYPAHNISEVVRELGIKIGILTVPSEYAQISTDRLVSGGIKGIMNFTPITIKTRNNDIPIKNLHIMEEFRVLSLMMDIKEKEK